MAKVSVIIPCYNLGEYIEEAVDSVLNQTYSDFEIIIVNDGSTDEYTNNLLEQAQWPKTRIFKTANQGLPATRNYGIERASGDYICCLDADDKYHPEFLRKAVMILENDFNCKIGIVTTHFELFGEKSYTVEVGDYNPFSLAVENQLHVASLFRRKAWKEVGGYATNLEGYQDWNLWLSIVAKGYEWSVVNEVLFYYRDRKGSMLKSSDRKRIALVDGILFNNKDFYLENSEAIIREFIKYVTALLGHSKYLQEQNKQLQEQNKQLQEQNKQITNSLEYIVLSKLRVLAERVFLFRYLLKGIFFVVRWLYKGAQISFGFIERIATAVKYFFIKIKAKFYRNKNEKRQEGLPLITIVIPCFNYGRYVEEAIDSVLSQTFQNYEIIVVDGGSTDNETIKMLEAIDKPKVEVHFRDGRHLVGDNRNYGIERARGKYICCLDADDLLESTYLEKALFFLETYGYDVVHPSAQCFGGSDFLWRATATSFKQMISHGNAVATVAVFKKEAWQEVGGYKDWPIGEGHVPEDWDFWARLLGYGYSFKPIDEPLMLYRVHNVSLTAKAKTSLNHQIKVIHNENNHLNSKEYRALRRSRRKIPVKAINPYINLIEKKSKKRILVALPFMIIGGADTIFSKVFAYLSCDYEIVFITTSEAPAECGDTSGLFSQVSGQIYHLNKFLADYEKKDYLDYLLTAKQIDMLFLAGSDYIYHQLPYLKTKYPELVIVDQLFNEFGHIKNNRKYAKYIDLNIVASDYLKNILITHYHEKPEKVISIVHGVDTNNDFNPELYKNDNIIKENNMVISYFGRLSEEKNPLMIIDIANKVKDYNIVFNIIGNGPLFKDMNNAVNDNGLNRKVRLFGFVESIKELLGQTDLVIITSKIEGIPIIIMEALSFGKAVVTASVGGIPGVINDGYNGYLCGHDKVDDFVKKILFLYNNRDKLKEISDNARNYAVEHLSIDTMNRKYKDAIDKLILGDSR